MPAPGSDLKWLDAAFPPPLNASVREALASSPQHTALFRSIATHILTLSNSAPTVSSPSPKKRKLTTTPPRSEAAPLLTVEGLSFSVPVRKKFNLSISTRSISALSPATGATEFSVNLDDIEYICCLPVPDKAARQWNFCIIPTNGCGLGTNTQDAVVFTIPDGAPKTAAGDALGSGHDTSSYRTLLIAVLNSLLPSSKALISSVEEPKESVFHSILPQSHRKGEKAFHVKAHRGSKEGYLFFLRRGIMWAFKKPLLHFPFTAIRSVSYTSITKRTFNLSIHVSDDLGGQDLEFSMIDQEDYGGIDAYIKAHKLNDESMADQRAAKKFNVNGKVDEEAGGDGTGELEKAWGEAEEDEEDEEDYVPEGEDDGGSGTSGSDDGSGSEDGGDEENMDSDDDEGSVDLGEELGSEMEEVEPEEPKQKRVKRVIA